MPDIRELFDNPEEAFRTMWAGIQSHMHTMLISSVSAASDGKTVRAVPAVKQRLVDKTGTQTTFEDYSELVDVPPHFPGGARMTLTHGINIGDEAAILFNGRAHDGWFEQGAGAQPVSDRMHSLSDGIAFPGLRSKPRELKQIDTAAMHLRDDAKLHVHETHPDRGHRTFSADPSTPAASDTFDPLSQAQTFIDHAVQGGSGLLGRAVSGSTVHDHGITHADGPFMRAKNAMMSVLCHPTNGASLNAQNLLHSVTAGPIGAIMSAFGGKHTVSALASGLSLQSATGIALQCPPGGLALPGGSIAAAALAAGAASTNVGPVGGDIFGSLPNPLVTSLHVDFSKLPAAGSDSAAATAGVIVGGLYRNTAVSSGVSLLAVRMV